MTDLKKYLNGVEGFLTDKEGELLFKLAKKVKEGAIVEIGSWKGKSTICLALGSKLSPKRRVFAIDPHTGSSEHQSAYGSKVWTFDVFKENIKRANVEDMIEPIIETSSEAVKNFKHGIGLVFIDGAHEYDDVKTDFLNWFPKVVEGGVVVFHDTIGWLGPRKVVEEYLYKSKNFKNVRFVDSITYGQKTYQNNFFDRLENRYTLILRNFSEYIRSLQIPKPIKAVGKKVLEFIH
jgi:predicted O-methyltransferase YrrM